MDFQVCSSRLIIAQPFLAGLFITDLGSRVRFFLSEHQLVYLFVDEGRNGS